MLRRHGLAEEPVELTALDHAVHVVGHECVEVVVVELREERVLDRARVHVGERGRAHRVHGHAPVVSVGVEQRLVEAPCFVQPHDLVVHQMVDDLLPAFDQLRLVELTRHVVDDLADRQAALASVGVHLVEEIAYFLL